MKRRAAASLCTLAAGLLAIAGPGCDEKNGGDTPGDPQDASSPGQDGAPPDGGSQPDSGVSIVFRYLDADGNPVPKDKGDIEFPEFTLKEMAMQLHRLELTGDTADSGDLHQRSRVLDYPWAAQPSISFPSAPPGIYSRLDYRVEMTYSDEDTPPGFKGDRLSIRVVGEAAVQQGALTFEYRDDKKVDVMLDFKRDVPPGEVGTIFVDLDLAGWFEVVDWQALADDDDDDGGGGEDGGGEDGGGEDDGGEDDDNSGPGNGDGSDADIVIGVDGDRETADAMRESLRASFTVGESE